MVLDKTLQPFVDFILQLLISGTDDQERLVDRILKRYRSYRIGKNEALDPEKDFAIGVVLLALGEFNSAIDAFWNAINELKSKQGTCALKANGQTEITQVRTCVYYETSLRYCEYLAKAYLSYMRDKFNQSKKHVKLERIENLLDELEDIQKKYRDLINSSKSRSKRSRSTSRKIKELLAAAYEAASRCACRMSDEAKAEKYFRKARTMYEEAGSTPKEFSQWQDLMQKKNFCAED